MAVGEKEDAERSAWETPQISKVMEKTEHKDWEINSSPEGQSQFTERW